MLIGVDIGGTKIRAVLWNGKRITRSLEIATPKSRNDFREEILALMASLAGKSSVRGIGIGAAGIVKKTTLLFSPNIPSIKNFNFRRLFHRAIPLRVDNDARCFCRAELLKGAGRGARSLFALTIGTGIGRAYGKNGKAIRLKRFEYPEPWEGSYQILRHGSDGDRLARFLARNLAPLIEPYKPAIVVIGGGVVKRRGFLAGLRAAFKARGSELEIRRARFDKNAVALGAALLFTR